MSGELDYVLGNIQVGQNNSMTKKQIGNLCYGFCFFAQVHCKVGLAILASMFLWALGALYCSIAGVQAQVSMHHWSLAGSFHSPNHSRLLLAADPLAQPLWAVRP